MAAANKILIVGGGITGLTAAYRLSRERGFSVTLIESSSQLGGLAAGFPLLGTSLEKTYHHLFMTDAYILKLIEELGLNNRLMWCNSSIGIFRDGCIFPFTTPADLLRFRPCTFYGRVRTGLVVLYLKHKKNWRNLAGKSARAWMNRFCGPSAMNVIWTPLLKGKFGSHYDSISMAWLWARIHIRANSREPGSANEKLGYFRGGFNVMVRALETAIREGGVNIQCGATLEKFLPDQRAAIINGAIVTFDSCVFTGPSNAFARVLPKGTVFDDYVRQLCSINYLGAVSLIFVTDQLLGDFYWINVNDPDTPFLVFLNHTQLVDKTYYHGKYVYYIGAYLQTDGQMFCLSDDALAKLWLGYLPKMFPAFDAGKIRERHVFRFSAAQHVVDTYYCAKIPDYCTPLPGVLLANYSHIFPEDRGTNFAVREGNKIADIIKRG